MPCSRAIPRFGVEESSRSVDAVARNTAVNTNPKEVIFPLTVRFEDGSTELYSDERDLETNLEDFNSEIDTECQVVDALGRQVFLRLKLLSIEELRLY